MKDNSRVRFWVDKTGFFAESAMLLLMLAVVHRIIGCWGLWRDRVDGIMMLLLPIVCCILLDLCILLLGKKGFFLSIIPVLLGVVFFVYKSLSFTNWVHTVLCILLYLVVAVVYTATVFGWVQTKWLLPPLIALPFLYKVIVEDIPALNNAAQPVTFSAGMQEMSILHMIAALFCVSMALKPKIVPAPAAPVQEEPAPVPTPVPTSAPVPAAPAVEPAPAAAMPEPAAAPAEEEETEEPYTPMLTLEPEPWEPESAGEEGKDESEHE